MIKPATRGHKLIEVPVLIDRERMLRMDSFAMECILDETGKNIMRGEFIPANFKDFSVFIWACAQTDAEESTEDGGCSAPLTLETVMDSLFIHQFREVVEVVTALLGGSETDPNSLAPYVPSDLNLIHQGLKIAGTKPGDVFWDLGCGDGRALALARRMGAEVYGVENDGNRAKLARGLIKRQGIPEENVVHGQIQEVDWSGADVVFTYLQTQAYEVLGPLFIEKLKAGTRVLSHDFSILNWVPIKQTTVRIEGEVRPHLLLLYEIGKSDVERKDGLYTEAEVDLVTDDLAKGIDSFFDLVGLADAKD